MTRVMPVYRHRLPTRIWHWVNAIAVFILIGSGLGISNAHPRLYWGEYGANFDPAWLELPFFPSWLTIPSNYNLALSRRWHMAFALVLAFGLLAFMLTSLINRHFARDLRLRRNDLTLRALKRDLDAHLELRFDDPANGGTYNLIQMLSYIVVIFGLLPLAILTGLTLSPAMAAAWPWLLDLFGGRQSARSIHVLTMAALSLFIIVHVAAVLLSRPFAQLRAMMTGWWHPSTDGAHP